MKRFYATLGITIQNTDNSVDKIILSTEGVCDGFVSD